MKYRNLMIVALGILSMACQREDAELQTTGSGTPMVLTNRAGGDESPVFTNGDKLGMYVVTAGTDLKSAENIYTNICLTNQGGVWSGGAMYYPNTSNVDIYNYSPWQNNVADVRAMNVNVVADQTADGAYRRSDFLWAKTADQAKTKEGVAIALKHRMSKAEISLIAGNGITEEYLKTVISVKLLNLKTTAVADLSTGEVTVADGAVDMNINTAPAGELLWMAIVAPQAVAAGTDAIEITLGDHTKRLYKLDRDITYQAGKVKHFDITVSNESIAVSVVSIDEWTSDGTLIEGDAKIEVSTSGISGEGTATGTSFVKDSRLGMYFYTGNAAMTDGSNVLYTAGDNGSLSSNTTLYYPTSNTVNIYAYAPYAETIANPELYSFNVSGDQRVAANVTASDLLVAKAEGLKNGGPAASLSFRHIMTQVVINLKKGNGITEGELSAANVSVENVMRNAQINLKTGVCGQLSDKNNISPAQNGNVYTAILLPQTLSASETFLKIGVGGMVWVYKTDLELKAGSRYTLNVSVSNSGISVGTPVITDWYDEPAIDVPAEKLVPHGALLDGDAVSKNWDKIVTAGGDMLLISEKEDMTYVYINPADNHGVIMEIAPDGMPGRIITADEDGMHTLASFFEVTPQGSTDPKLGLGIVTTDKQIALLEPEAMPEAIQSGDLTKIIQYIVNKLAEVLETNGMTGQLPPENLGCASVLINLLPQVDLGNLPSFAVEGNEVLEQAGMGSVNEIVEAIAPAGELVARPNGDRTENAFETTEDAYQTELDLIRDASKYGFGDVKVTLKWDCSGDVDLHVKDPDGHHIYYGDENPAACEGSLDKDNQSGYGPENIFFEKGKAPQGIYKVKINNYSKKELVGFTLFIYAKGRAKTYSGTLTGSILNAYFEFDLNGNFRENTTAWSN